MGVYRFESNEVKRPNKNNPAKIRHFDCSPQQAISATSGCQPNEITLKNPRKTSRDESVWDVYMQRQDQAKPFKVGEVFYHAPDWPGGPARRFPVSTEQSRLVYDD